MASVKQFSEKKDNIAAIISFIRRNGAVTRMEICKALSLSWACVSDLVARLIEDTVLIEAAYPAKEDAPATKGRTPTLLSLNKRKYFLGVDINNFGIGVTVLSMNGERIASKKWQAKRFSDEHELMLSVCERISEMLANPKDCCGVGVAVEGMRSENGGFLYPMTGGCTSVFPQRVIAEHFDLPVVARHDPECVLYSVAESCGEDCLVIRADTEEIGVAAMKNGKIMELPLELGHVRYRGERLREILHSCTREGNYGEIAEALGYSVANLAMLLGIRKCFLVGEWLKWFDSVSEVFDMAFGTVSERIKYEICVLSDASDGAARLAMAEYPTLNIRRERE